MFLKKIFKVGSKGDKTPRKAHRVGIPGLRAKLVGRPMSFSVRDLSATGIGLLMTGRPLAVGSQFKLNLFQGPKLLLKELQVKVVRIGEGFVGCLFENLEPKQSDYLHALCLEEQKKLADIKKKEAERKEKVAKAKAKADEKERILKS